MTDEKRITEYYSISCRPYDAEGGAASLLESARREFFSRGSARGSVRTVEDGREVRVRYRFGPGCFRWKKICGRATLQEAFPVAGGMFRLVTHTAEGRLLAAVTYDEGLRWVQSAYYDGDPLNPVAVLRRQGEGLAMLRGGGTAALAPCPWLPGSAEQSFVNASTGEPDVVARTDAGDFCFCRAEECARRLELLAQAGQRAAFGGEECPGGELHFQVVPNAPVESPVALHPAASENPKTSPTPQVQSQRGLQSVPKNENAYAAACISPPPPSGRPAKYAVAAKGLSGGLRVVGQGQQARPREPEQKPDDPGGCSPVMGPLPAKRIALPGGESYLYYGQVCGGLRQGEGRTASPEGNTVYEGGYCNDLRHGFGVYYSKSGHLRYAGAWQNGLRDGPGVAFGGGGVFAGTFRAGLAEGCGSELSAGGELCFTGSYRGGLRDGFGVEFADGRVLRSGVWRAGIFAGEADSPHETG